MLALWVIGSTTWHAWFRTLPEAEVMGAVAVAAIIANGIVALMLYRYRAGDANMRSVWICSRNDVIGNLAVLLAAAGCSAQGRAGPILSSPRSWHCWASAEVGRSFAMPLGSYKLTVARGPRLLPNSAARPDALINA